MNTIPNNLKEAERLEFINALNNIVKTVSPEKIICYGSRTSTCEDWSSFWITGQSRVYANYDLLIITKDGESRKAHEIQEAIFKHNNDKLHIAAIVHSISYVNEAIQNGSTFFNTLYHKGVAVYECNTTPLAPPPVLQYIDITEMENRLEKRWNKWFGLAQRALNEAIHCFSHGEHELALCMLQQAAEYTCVAIIRISTGYRPNSHNLSKLLELTENVSIYIAVVFPRITKEEQKLYNVLLYAYSSIRYKENYSVSAETVNILIDRVKELQAIAEKLYNNKISEITKNKYS